MRFRHVEEKESPAGGQNREINQENPSADAFLERKRHAWNITAHYIQQIRHSVKFLCNEVLLQREFVRFGHDFNYRKISGIRERAIWIT